MQHHDQSEANDTRTLGWIVDNVLQTWWPVTLAACSVQGPCDDPMVEKKGFREPVGRSNWLPVKLSQNPICETTLQPVADGR